MLIIPGIIASSYPAVTNSYESIATVTVGAGGSSTISFTSIPSTYKHLQIRAIARVSSGTAGSNSAYFRFNSDTGSNYAAHSLMGDGSSASATASTGITYATYAGRNMIIRNGTTASIFGVGIVDILDYANTNKYKTIRSLTGNDRNGSGEIMLNSALWQSTTAINSISITDESGYSFAQYSSFALYGVK